MQCTTAFGEMHSPLLSAALENRLTAALCHCNYTHEDLLFIQVCSDPPPMHCSTGFGNMHSRLLRAALQNSSQQPCITAITPMKICCSYRCAMTHHQCTAALLLVKCTPNCSGLLLKTGSQQPCVTEMTHMKICCSYRCAMTHQQCTAALVLAKCTPHCSGLLCQTGWQ